MSLWSTLAAFAVMTVACALQGTVGFGSALVAGPVLVLIDPGFVPAPLVATGVALNALTMRRERVAGAWREIRWPLVGLLPGTVVGGLIVAHATGAQFAVGLGVLTLVAVALSAGRGRVHRSPLVGSSCGALSGFMGTIAGIGGPPIVLLYQHESGRHLRMAVSRFFLVSALLSLVSLAAARQVDADAASRLLVLLPGTVCGYLLSGRLLHRVDRRHLRRAVLAISASAAVLSIVSGLR